MVSCLSRAWSHEAWRDENLGTFFVLFAEGAHKGDLLPLPSLKMFEWPFDVYHALLRRMQAKKDTMAVLRMKIESLRTCTGSRTGV